MSAPYVPPGLSFGAAPGKAVLPVSLPKDERLQDYMVEWWYFIALLTEDGTTNRFAVEMTAARLTLSPMRAMETAYIAVIEPGAAQPENRYVSADRQSMDAYDSNATHLRMRFAPSYGQPGDWRIEGWALDNTPVRYEIEGAFAVEEADTSTIRQRAVLLEFRDSAAHPPLLHGNAGVIDFFGLQMGYYSRTRLTVQGVLKIDARIVPVSGLGWMDHEWGTADLPGSRWMFVAIQLDGGDEICAYRVDRRREGTQGVPYGYVLGQKPEMAEKDKVVISSLGVLDPYGYSLAWRVQITFPSGRTEDLRVEAEFPEQRRVPTGELALPFVTLWEGAALVSEFATGKRVGRAFLEMGGYE